MDTYQKLDIQEKEVFLKKINKLTISLAYFYLAIFIFTSNFAHANQNNKKILNALDHMYKTKEFSAKFIQNEGGSLSEGNLYFRNDRIRVDYINPNKIKIIIDKKKAMYFNKDLEEVEYFNPQKTPLKIFYDIFKNKEFFFNSNYIEEKNQINIKKIIFLDEVEFEIKILLETKPTILKKISIKNYEQIIELSIINANFNPNLNEKFFSMINPTSIK